VEGVQLVIAICGSEKRKENIIIIGSYQKRIGIGFD